MRKALCFLALALALSSAPARATIAVNNAGVASSGGTSIVLTLGVNIPAKSNIIVFVYERAASMTSTQFGTLTDSASNSYTLGGPSLPFCAYVASASYGKLCAFVAVGASAVNSGGTITYTKFSSGSNAALSAVYVTGASTNANTIFCDTGSGTSTAPIASYLAGIGQQGVVIGAAAWNGVQTFTQATGFSNPPNYSNIGSFVSMEGGYKLTTLLAGGVPYSTTLNGSVQWGAVICGIPSFTSGFIFTPAIIP